MGFFFFLAERRPLNLLAAGHASAGRDPDVESDPESLWSSCRQTASQTASVQAPHHSGEERGYHISFFFFFFFREKHIVQIKSSADQKLPKKKKKKDCILTGIMNEHKEIIQCSTNKIVFTYSMYCQWPITRCLQ